MKYISKLDYHLANDSLYRNSIYLMLSTAIMAFFGFFFWIINARLFTPEQVGIATTLISVVSLVTSFSLLGLNNGLIRYLPTSQRRNEKINTTFTLVTITSVAIAFLYILFIKVLSPGLVIIRENMFYAFLLILVTIFATLNTIIESVFISYRSSKYILIKNTILSAIKLALPVFLVSLGAYGIFMSLGIATAVGSLIGIGILLFKFNYLLKPTLDKNVLKGMMNFSLGNYAAGFIGGAPAMILPIIILNNLGAKFSAYFYMDMMIANLLYIIPLATSQSLFAEGSYSEVELKQHVIKAGKIIALIMIPGIIITLLFGKYILLAFGKQYTTDGFLLLQILALSGISLAVINIGNVILNIKHKVKLIVLLNCVSTILILFFSIFFLKESLLGIGLAWFIGQGVISIIYLYAIKKIL